MCYLKFMLLILSYCLHLNTNDQFSQAQPMFVLLFVETQLHVSASSNRHQAAQQSKR